MKMKQQQLKLHLRIDGIRSLNRATKAIKKSAKALERLTDQIGKASAAFTQFKDTLPVLMEYEVENE